MIICPTYIMGLLPDWQEGLRNKVEKVAAYILNMSVLGNEAAHRNRKT